MQAGSLHYDGDAGWQPALRSDAIVISNNSGQGAAALARRRFGETVAASVSLSGDWYCRNYQQYVNREAELPVDQHMLVA